MVVAATLIYNKVEIYLLIFLRIFSFMVVSPTSSRRNIPVYVKVGFSLIMAYIIFSIKPEMSITISNIIGFVFIILKEMITGFILGYIATLAFSTILITGQLIDTNIGFGMSSVYDPQTNVQVPLTSNFLNILFVLLFLAADGHHALIMILAESFDYIHIGETYLSKDIVIIIVDIFVKMFATAFKMALPIITATLICDVVLGILVRTVPQMNVFVIGMPFKIIIGLLVLYLSIGLMSNQVTKIFNEMFFDLENIINGMTLK